MTRSTSLTSGTILLLAKNYFGKQASRRGKTKPTRPSHPCEPIHCAMCFGRIDVSTYGTLPSYHSTRTVSEESNNDNNISSIEATTSECVATSLVLIILSFLHLIGRWFWGGEMNERVLRSSVTLASITTNVSFGKCDRQSRTYVCQYTPKLK